jgi:hypothetical protein
MTVLSKQRTKSEWMVITPSIAEEWLNKYNTGNRKLRHGVVEKYTSDMKKGKWTRNPQPIMFYEDGELADGQHRLWAIVESRKAIEFFVQWGVTRENALNIDTGFGRDIVDNAHIGGYTGYINKRAIAAAIIVHYGKRMQGEGRILSNTERLALVQKYEEHLQFMDQAMPGGKKFVCTAPLCAAMARAHMHEGDNSRLIEFGQVLSTGIPKHAIEDRAALALRNYMMEIAADRKLDPRDTFMKAMNAIHYFVKRKPLTTIRVMKDEVYPLRK